MSRGKIVNWFCVEIHVKTEVLNISYYRNSNWGRVMFPQVSVNLFTEEWVSLVPCPFQWVGISGPRSLMGVGMCKGGGWVCAGVGVGTHLPQTCCSTGCGQQVGGVHPTRILFVYTVLGAIVSRCCCFRFGNFQK